MLDFGTLDAYIAGVALKRISQVECEETRSHQHELNGVKEMRKLFGTTKKIYPTRFIRLEDDEEKSGEFYGEMTWYDAREAHPTRTEYRFYYQKNVAIERASPEDVLGIILKKDGHVLFVTAPKGSQAEAELFELFGSALGASFSVVNFVEQGTRLTLARRMILEALGIESVVQDAKDYLGFIEKKLGSLSFPNTKTFSRLAREAFGGTEGLCADERLIYWWNTEETMFKQLENVEIENRLREGFCDADDFLTFSQFVRQRRSSRAGSALENHLREIFETEGVMHSHGKKTEGNKKPDFIFPSIEKYHEAGFCVEKLTMLGVKTTCKDRWRQVLTEADKIPNKHLLTLQPKISNNQLDEMFAAHLCLVIPLTLQESYCNTVKRKMWSLEDFLRHVKQLQHAC